VRLDKRGFIKWERRSLFISRALAHEYIQITPALDANVDGRWEVHWGPIRLGSLDEHRAARGLIVARRPRGTVAISLVDETTFADCQ
jgi:hypothetical protein